MNETIIHGIDTIIPISETVMIKITDVCNNIYGWQSKISYILFIYILLNFVLNNIDRLHIKNIHIESLIIHSIRILRFMLIIVSAILVGFDLKLI